MIHAFKESYPQGFGANYGASQQSSCAHLYSYIRPEFNQSLMHLFVPNTTCVKKSRVVCGSGCSVVSEIVCTTASLAVHSPFALVRNSTDRGASVVFGHVHGADFSRTVTFGIHFKPQPSPGRRLRSTPPSVLSRLREDVSKNWIEYVDKTREVIDWAKEKGKLFDIEDNLIATAYTAGSTAIKAASTYNKVYNMYSKVQDELFDDPPTFESQGWVKYAGAFYNFNDCTCNQAATMNCGNPTTETPCGAAGEVLVCLYLVARWRTWETKHYAPCWECRL